MRSQTVSFPDIGRLQIAVKRPTQSWIAAFVGLTVIAGLSAFVVSNSSRASMARPAAVVTPVGTVTAYSVQLSPIVSRITASGTVAARHTVDIGSEVSGLRIVEVNADEGDFVRKGSVLARMNSEILQAQLSRENANLNGALASVSKARQPNRVEDIAGLQAAEMQAESSINQAQANLKRAETNLANLKQTAGRYDYLGAQGAVSQQDTANHKAAAAMAESEVAAARQQLEGARYIATQAKERLHAAAAGGRQEDISISLSTVDQIRASIRQIEAQLAQAVVRAPSDGMITKRNAEVGEISSAGQSLFVMAKNGALELQAQIQEIDLPGVSASQAVTITPASLELPPLQAQVREVSPVVDPRTRLGTVYIDIASNTGFKQGMYATALIETGSRSALAVPAKAVLVQENSTSIVFVLNGERVTRRVVQVGGLSGDIVEITGGLSVGEQVVVAGAGFLKDGDAVRVHKNA